MLSKAKLKYIKSLQIKKFRRENGEFLVEGAKSVLELLHSDFKISSLFLTQDFLVKYKESSLAPGVEIVEVTADELSAIGSFESNNAALAIVKMRDNKPLFIEKDEFMLALDDVKDPGNLGTIIRIADWYGIRKIVCSAYSAELYNPKVISSSMGSFTRVSVFYTELKEYLSNIKVPVLGATLGGQPIYNMIFPSKGIILMGNESVGIDPEIFPLITNQLTIPRIGHAESLNVSVATGIICDRIFNK